MTLLADVLDPVALATAVESGYVRRQRHPGRPLVIYNYTEACQYAGAWTPVTLACRGLIATEDGQLVARSFDKFFNHDQPQAPVLDPTAPVRVTDKADGSLGITYPADDGWAIATRGSFASDQAQHATALLHRKYPDFAPPPGWTVLFEIIYPANRIVLDYAGLDDLVLLGAVELATGRTAGPDAVPSWPGPVVDSFDFATLADALAAPPRADREGLVVHFTATDQRVKIKYADYVRLHRLVTGLTARTVWEVLAAGGDVAKLTEPLPDEFHVWVRRVADELTATVGAQTAAIEAAYAEIVAELPTGWGRKEFAAVAQRSEYRFALFRRLDGKDYRPTLWQHARPSADKTMTKVTEE